MKSCQNCPILHKSIFNYKNNVLTNKYPVHKHQLNIKKGELIFGPNSDLEGIYCIKRGNVKIVKSDTNGKDTILRIANEGDIIGEEILLNNSEPEKSAIAISDSVVCYIEKMSFTNILKHNDTLSYNLLKKMSEVLKKSEDHICSCHQKKVIARLSEFLIEFKTNEGILESDKWKIDLNLSRDELAMIIGTAPETIIRAFSDLKKMGVISGQKIIYILDESMLNKIANCD